MEYTNLWYTKRIRKLWKRDYLEDCLVENECKLQEYRMIWFDKELKKLFGCTEKSGRAMHVYIGREAEVGDWEKWINNRIKEATRIRTLGGCCVVGNG